ncbi:MAG: hypothetical protein ACTSWW_11640, partial [Promethearchaeota archaeon]
AGNRYLKDGGNLSFDFRTYYARCWVLEKRWEHTMVFLTDPKLDMRWRDLRAKHLRKLCEPTNVLMIVTDSTKEDVEAVKQSFQMWPRIKRKFIIFVIANMQDLPDRLSVPEIKTVLQMEDVIGLSATDPGAKEIIEEFLERATLRYFQMLSKRGTVMAILGEDEIGFGKTQKERVVSKGKYSARIKKVKATLEKREKT